MATSEVLLLEKIEGLGSEGDQVKVKAGFARNFLLPRRHAVPVSRANKKQIEALLKAREVRESKELEEATSIADRIKGISIAIAVKTGKGGKMFGAVTANDLLARLGEEGVELNKKQLSLAHPAKELGKHTARIKLHHNVVVDLNFEVVSENPIEEEL